MIKNRTFSPFLYGATLGVMALISGAYLQSAADPNHVMSRHLSGDLPDASFRSVRALSPAAETPEDWVAELTSLRPVRSDTVAKRSSCGDRRARAARAAAALEAGPSSQPLGNRATCETGN